MNRLKECAWSLATCVAWGSYGPGLNGFTEGLRQTPTEFRDQRAQGRGDGLRVAARGGAGSGQASLADLHGFISTGSGEPPFREECSPPFGIHVELLHIDRHSQYHPVVFRSGEIGPIRGQQQGQILRERLPKGLVQPFGPERSFEALNFVGALADNH